MNAFSNQAMLSSAFGFILFDEWPKLEEISTPDDAMMYKALHLSSHGVGRTHPNPPVGAVVAKGKDIIAQGYHERAGLPHAEAQALKSAGENSRDADLFVTLEPCTHFGRTPPCVNQVLNSGVARVRVGTLDPNPVVHEHGLGKLQEAKFDAKLTQNFFLSNLAERMIAPFATTMTKKRPYVVLKIASSLDGKVAKRVGERSAITGKAAAKIVHKLRDKCDAVAIGRATVEIDDPKLTVREVATSDERQPLRVVFDSALKLKTNCQVFEQGNCVVVHEASAANDKQSELNRLGIKHVAVKQEQGGLAISESLSEMHKMGLTSVLVEGGAKLWTSFINAGLVDEIWWFTAPIILGEGGKSALEKLAPGVQEWLCDASHERFDQQVDSDHLTIIRIKKSL